jgi:hypothetical protein
VKFEELEALVSRVSYKDGIEIRVDRWLEDRDVVSISVGALRANSRRPGDTIGVSVTESIGLRQFDGRPELWQKFVIDRVRRLVHRLEIHEADEWLKLDGKLIADPHPEELP